MKKKEQRLLPPDLLPVPPNQDDIRSNDPLSNSDLLASETNADGTEQEVSASAILEMSDSSSTEIESSPPKLFPNPILASEVHINSKIHNKNISNVHFETEKEDKFLANQEQFSPASSTEIRFLFDDGKNEIVIISNLQALVIERYSESPELLPPVLSPVRTPPNDGRESDEAEALSPPILYPMVPFRNINQSPIYSSTKIENIANETQVSQNERNTQELEQSIIREHSHDTETEKSLAESPLPSSSIQSSFVHNNDGNIGENSDTSDLYIRSFESKSSESLHLRNTECIITETKEVGGENDSSVNTDLSTRATDRCEEELRLSPSPSSNVTHETFEYFQSCGNEYAEAYSMHLSTVVRDSETSFGRLQDSNVSDTNRTLENFDGASVRKSVIVRKSESISSRDFIESGETVIRDINDTGTSNFLNTSQDNLSYPSLKTHQNLTDISDSEGNRAPVVLKPLAIRSDYFHTNKLESLSTPYFTPTSDFTNQAHPSTAISPALNRNKENNLNQSLFQPFHSEKSAFQVLEDRNSLENEEQVRMFSNFDASPVSAHASVPSTNANALQFDYRVVGDTESVEKQKENPRSPASERIISAEELHDVAQNKNAILSDEGITPKFIEHLTRNLPATEKSSKEGITRQFTAHITRNVPVTEKSSEKGITQQFIEHLSRNVPVTQKSREEGITLQFIEHLSRNVPVTQKSRKEGITQQFPAHLTRNTQITEKTSGESLIPKSHNSLNKNIHKIRKANTGGITGISDDNLTKNIYRTEQRNEEATVSESNNNMAINVNRLGESKRSTIDLPSPREQNDSLENIQITQESNTQPGRSSFFLNPVIRNQMFIPSYANPVRKHRNNN